MSMRPNTTPRENAKRHDSSSIATTVSRFGKSFLNILVGFRCSDNPGGTSWRCRTFRLFELRDHGLHGFVVLPLPYQPTLRSIDGKQGQERLSAYTT